MKTPTLFSYLVLALCFAFANAIQAAPDDEKKPRPEKQEKAEAQKKKIHKSTTEKATPKQEKAASTSRAGKRPFLGVATSPVAPSVKEYLDLDEGFGIQLHQILPDSPAAKAGLKQHDVLLKLEDQLLVSPEHLSLLVRTKPSGDKIDVTIVRKGTEKVISVTLGEKEESFFAPRIHGKPMPASPPHFTPYSQEWHEQLKRQQDQWRKKWIQPSAPGQKATKNETAELQGKPPAVSVRPGFPVSVFGTQGVLKIDNQEGEVTITEKDGKHKIEIEDKAGKSIYKGDFDPETGVESLPKEARDHLETMKLDNLEVLTPPAPKVEKTSTPAIEKKKPSSPKDDIL
jgi:membrane-associated protease RseP (regulator of RpoE activity)